MALILYVAKIAVDKDSGLPLPELRGQGGTIISRGNPSVVPTIYEDKDGSLAIPGSSITINDNLFTSSFWVDEADLPISWWDGSVEVPLESTEGIAIRMEEIGTDATAAHAAANEAKDDAAAVLDEAVLTVNGLPRDEAGNVKVFHTGEMPAGSDFDTFVGEAHQGVYLVRSATSSATMVNIPEAWPGVLEVISTHGDLTSLITVQRFTTYGAQQREACWWRVSANTTGTAWTAWKRLDVDNETRSLAEAALEISTENVAGSTRHDMRVSEFRRRRGGTVGTDGKPVVALRFDHGLNVFQSDILPLLRQYNLPASLALCSRQFTDANGVTDNDAVSFPIVQGWALADGIDVWNHGATHRDAQTVTELTAEIATARDELAAALPRMAIEGYMIPGVTPVDPEDEPLGGFGNGSTIEAFFDTTAGRMIVGNHAVSMGYLPGIVRPLDGSLMQGQGHLTIDGDTTGSSAANLVDLAVAHRSGVCLMLHPVRLDKPGYISSAVLEALFADLAARRDAGEIEVLTVSALSVASIDSANRPSLVRNGDLTSSFSDDWAGAAGWSSADESGTPYLAGTDTAGLLVQTASVSRVGACRGAVWRLEAQFRSAAGGDARLSVENSSDAGDYTATDVFAVPGDGEWHTHSIHTSVPLDVPGLRFRVGRDAGGALDVRRVRFVAS